MKKNLLKSALLCGAIALPATYAAADSSLSVALDNAKVYQGQSVTLTPTIDDATGEAPFTYQWTDNRGNVVGNEPTLTVSPSQLTHYCLTVTDAAGRSANTKSIVYVIGDAVTATFEDATLADGTEITLDSESFWLGYGDDDYSTGVDTEWYSGSYMMIARRYYDYWWYGYGLTNNTGDTYSGASAAETLRSAAGGPYAGSNFCVAYPYSMPYTGYDGEIFCIYVTNSEDGDVINGVYVTNTPYAYSSIINGDSYGSVAFATGDYFKLIATGYNGDTETGSLTFYLADYTSETEADHYALSSWQWFDLRELGSVTSVGLTFETTQANEWGALTPLYVALDNFNGEREITSAQTLESPLGNNSYSLADYFSFESTEANVAYALEVTAADDGIELSLDSDNNLVVYGTETDATATAIIEGVQAGIRKYVQLPVLVTDQVGITSALADINNAVNVYPSVVSDAFTVASDLDNYTVNVYSINGTRVLSQDANGSATIDATNLAAGVYLVEIGNENATTVKRVIVK